MFIIVIIIIIISIIIVIIIILIMSTIMEPSAGYWCDYAIAVTPSAYPPKTARPSSLRRWLKAPFCEGLLEPPQLSIMLLPAYCIIITVLIILTAIRIIIIITISIIIIILIIIILIMSPIILEPPAGYWCYYAIGVTPLAYQPKTVWPSGLRRWLKASFGCGLEPHSCQ